MKKVGIEAGLTNVADFLVNKGYSVRTLQGLMAEDISSLNELDAIVIGGLSANTIGYDDPEVRAQLINADGLTPQEVENMIEGQN
ncbi:MAG: YkuS family protein [Natronincolaceae bacterium]|jgi:2-hydroxychromene-2-carboxylate isomerase|nr:YkuS family protein [Bacillota bacterium]